MNRLPLPLANLQKPSPLGLNPHLVDDLPLDSRTLLERFLQTADINDGIVDLTALAAFVKASRNPADIRATMQLLPQLYFAVDEADRPRHRQFLLRFTGALAMSFFGAVSAEMLRQADSNALLSAITALMLADADTAIDVFSKAFDAVYNKSVTDIRDKLRHDGINGYLTALDSLRFATEAPEMLPLAVAEMLEACMKLSQLNTSQWPLRRLRGVTAETDLDELAEDNAFAPLLPCLLWALELA